MKVLLSCACCFLALATLAGPTIDLNAIAVQVASNLSAKIAGALAAKTNAVLALATPENYALLKSSKLKDAAKKLALQKRLAEAALADAEQTEVGRLKWHGRYTSQKVDLDKLTATFVHADGTEYAVKFQRPDALREIAKANARLPKPPMTNGVPKALAAARTRRYEERLQPTQTVTTEVTATHGKRPTEGGVR